MVVCVSGCVCVCVCYCYCQEHEGLLGDSPETGAQHFPAASEARSGVSAAHGRRRRWKNCAVRN